MKSSPTKVVKVVTVADTGAQSDLWSLDEFLNAGYKISDLSPVSRSLNAANKSPIRIDGAFIASFSGLSPNGDRITCPSMVYVSRDVSTMYLSYDTMVDLGIVSHNFPQIGMYSASPCTEPTMPPSNADTVQICGVANNDGYDLSVSKAHYGS